MKILACVVLFQAITIIHHGKTVRGFGSYGTYNRMVNIDSLTNIYDTVNIYTNHGIKKYVP